MIYHLCLGSNLDDPNSQLDKAIYQLSTESGISILRKSSRIITKPYGMLNQPDFVNQVLEIESNDNPQDLMENLLYIEMSMGRLRRIKWGPRNIDIDILLAGDLVLDSRKSPLKKPWPQVIIPHPDLQNREFILRLLNELIPDAIHPVLHKTINEIYYELLAREQHNE